MAVVAVVAVVALVAMMAVVADCGGAVVIKKPQLILRIGFEFVLVVAIFFEMGPFHEQVGPFGEHMLQKGPFGEQITLKGFRNLVG